MTSNSVQMLMNLQMLCILEVGDRKYIGSNSVRVQLLNYTNIIAYLKLKDFIAYI